MKQKGLIALTVLLALAGLYCLWRYYRDAWLPNAQVQQALDAQKELFAQLRPDMEQPAGTEPEAPAPTEAAPPAGDAGDKPQPAGAETAEAEAPDPLAQLRSHNPDAVGWLSIAGTSVDYPIVQASDNDFYLQNGFDRQYNYVGCPFLDERCADGFGGFLAIVYAHHIRQEMFGDIARFRDSGYLRAHPSGALLAEDGLHTVRFFAYLTVPSSSGVYQTEFSDRAERDAYIDALFDAAVCTQGETAQALKQREGLRLLLLSTCTYEFEEARGVLVGVIE